ncbi:MAG TPA: AI-2E family transporter [bacterium]|nr:AI-2E family transporter [bacterium]
MNLHKALWLIGILLFLTLTSWLVYTLRTVLTPFLLAFLMAYILNPVIKFGVRRKLSRDFCVALLMLLLVLTVVVAGVVLVPVLVHQVTSLAAAIPNLGDQSAAAVARVQAFLNALPAVQRFYPNGITLQAPDLAGMITAPAAGATSTVVGVATDWSLGLFSGISTVLMLLFATGLFIISTIYLLRDYERLVARARELLPRRQEEICIAVITDIDRNLRNFFRGQLMVCLINSSILSTVLFIAGVPYALLIGFFTGFMNIIPYLGIALGMVLSLGIDFMYYGDAQHILYVLLAFGVQQALDASLITPRLLGDTVGLHPVAIIASFLIFGQLFGFFGVLLAVPLATIVKVLLAHGIRFYKQSWVYGGSQSIPPGGSV